MNIIESKSASVNLEKTLTYTEKNYNIYSKAAPLENLSNLQQEIIRTALNGLSIKKSIATLTNARGHINGSSLNLLLSLGVLYSAEHFIIRIIQHPLFELPLEYVDALIDTAYTLIKQHDIDSANLLTNYLTGVVPYNLKATALALKCSQHSPNRETTEALFSKLSDQDYVLEPALATLRIDYLVENSKVQEAKNFIESFRSLTHLPSVLLEKMTQFYIRAEDLESGRRLLRYWLRNDICYHTQFRTLFRLIESREHARQMIQQIESIDGWYRNPDLIICREGIELHPCFKEAAPACTIDASASMPGLNIASAAPNNVILFCFDGAYRVPALVAILGIIRELPSDRPKPVIALYIPVGEIPFWEKVTLQLINASTPVELRLIHEKIPQLQKNREHYKLLSDRKLPSIAYGRLFAIQLLLNEGYEKLLYLDSDIVVLGDVTPILSLNQLGYPISAVIERPIGIVGQTVNAHKILNKKYFNSGVMLIDLKHVAIKSIIDKAIDFILDPNTTLLFHDQCAINKAVQGYFHPLPEIYNFFLFPGAKPCPPGNVILHFLDSPKPWEAAHRGGSGIAIWRNQWLRAKSDIKRLGLDQLEI